MTVPEPEAINLEQPAVNGVPRLVQQGRRRWRIPFLLAASLLLILFLFHRSLLAGLGEALVVSDPLERADAIYVMAGDFWGSRVLLGAKLGSEGWAPKVILGGGLYGGDGQGYRESSDLAIDFAVQHGYPRRLFIPAPILASSTIQEARVLGPTFRKLGARRIILVTSNFHSRRALQVFRLFLPEFDFRMEGAPDSAFDPRTWWEKPQQRVLLFSEYEKILGAFLVRFHLASPDWLRKISSDVS